MLLRDRFETSQLTAKQVLVVMNFPEEQGRIRLPDWSTSTRLIEENPNGSETQTDRTNDRQRSEQERIWEESRDV